MTRPEPPEEERPAWAGAPGYHPQDTAFAGGTGRPATGGDMDAGHDAPAGNADRAADAGPDDTPRPPDGKARATETGPGGAADQNSAADGGDGTARTRAAGSPAAAPTAGGSGAATPGAADPGQGTVPPPAPGGQPASAPPPSGFQAYPEQYAHAPMPGAPPYPAPPPLEGPLSTRAPVARISFLVAMGAAGVWFVVDLVRTLVAYGRISVAMIGAMVVVTAIAALAAWLVTRRRNPAFWQLALLAAPLYVVLRLVAGLMVT